MTVLKEKGRQLWLPNRCVFLLSTLLLVTCTYDYNTHGSKRHSRTMKLLSNLFFHFLKTCLLHYRGTEKSVCETRTKHVTAFFIVFSLLNIGSHENEMCVVCEIRAK